MRTGQLRPQAKILDCWQLLHESDFEDTDTKLLLHLRNDVVDYATGKTVTNNSVTFSSTVWKFNGFSALFSTASLTLADNADWAFGTGNFTIDAWIKRSDLTGEQFVIAQSDSFGNDVSISFAFYISTAQSHKLIGWLYDSSNIRYTVISTGVINDTNWHHVAFVRDGNTLRLFIDGVADGTADVTGVTAFDSPNLVAIGEFNGYYFKGYIQELRLVKGTAKWTSNFTPPTVEYLGRTSNYYFRRDRNTKMMISGQGANNSTTIIDECGNPITATGDAKITTAQKKYGNSSIAFDGTGDYLTTGDSNDWYFGDQDFTVDTWVRWNNHTTSSGYQTIVQQFTEGGELWIMGLQGGSNLWMYFGNTSGGNKKGYYTCAFTPNDNQWYHLAFERIATGAKIFINGISQTLTVDTAFSTNSVTNVSANLDIGLYGASTPYYFNGWMSDIRISKGVARWTADFIPPTNTTALINGDTDEEYRLSVSAADGFGGTEFKARFNYDSTNYGFQRMSGTNTTVDASRSTDTGFSLGYASTVSYITPSDTIIYAKSGYVRTAITDKAYTVTGTTVTSIHSMGFSWNNTADPIAALIIAADQTNGIGLGTKFLLYRKVQ